MLKKIKKYKISIRPSFVLRNLKRKLNLDSMPDSLEKNMQETISRVSPLIVPSSIYNTYSKSETPEPVKGLWEYAPGQALSLSLILTTIGPLLEQEIEKSSNEPECQKATILDSTAREALEQSLHFISKLISEEAKLDGCTLTLFAPVQTALFKDALTHLESQKAEISLDADGRLIPTFSSFSFCFWVPVSKNRNGKVR